MIRQKRFAKLAIISGVGFLLSGIYSLVFLLLPAYDLAGDALDQDDEATKQATLTKLNEIQAQTDIIKIIQFVFLTILVASLVFIVAGIFKSHAERIKK